jgi:hypothetical protein
MTQYKSLIFLILLLVSSSSILAFRYSFFLFLKCLLDPHLTLLWFGSRNHRILARLLWSKRHKHSSSNYGLCYFHSYRPRLSLAKVLIFSFMFSQTIFMSSLSFKFSKTANLFEILIWYCFLTSSSFSFLRLNLSTSNHVLLVYVLPIFPWHLQHQLVINISVSSPERSYINHNRI